MTKAKVRIFLHRKVVYIPSTFNTDDNGRITEETVAMIDKEEGVIVLYFNNGNLRSKGGTSYTNFLFKVEDFNKEMNINSIKELNDFLGNKKIEILEVGLETLSLNDNKEPVYVNTFDNVKLEKKIKNLRLRQLIQKWKIICKTSV